MCRVIKGKKLSVKENMGFVIENQLCTFIWLYICMAGTISK